MVAPTGDGDGEAPSGPAPMTVIRQVVLMVGGTLLALLVALWLALDGQVTGSMDEPLPWILLTTGTLGCVAGLRFARTSPLRAGNLDEFIALHRSATFVGVAAAELPALLGFVASFVIGAMWPYLVGLVPAAFGIASLLPTRERLRSYDRQLRSRGVEATPSDLLNPG